jgi:hypothetical protein
MCEYGFLAARARSTENAAIANSSTPPRGGKTGHSCKVQQDKSVELTDCGLSGLVHVRLLLTQHFVAAAAYFMLQLQPKSWKRPFNDTDVSGFQTDPSPRLVRTNRGRTKRTRARVRFRAKSSRALQLQPLGH